MNRECENLYQHYNNNLAGKNDRLAISWSVPLN